MQPRAPAGGTVRAPRPTPGEVVGAEALAPACGAVGAHGVVPAGGAGGGGGARPRVGASREGGRVLARDPRRLGEGGGARRRRDAAPRVPTGGGASPLYPVS